MDVGDAKQVEKATRQYESREAIEREELKALLKLPAARRFIWTLLCMCGTNRLTFSGEETHTAAMLEGRRSVGNDIIAEIDAAVPHTYVGIYQEHKSREEEE